MSQGREHKRDCLAFLREEGVVGEDEEQLHKQDEARTSEPQFPHSCKGDDNME